MAWKADSVRATIFVGPAAVNPDALEVFSVATGGQRPDSFQGPKANPASVSMADGFFGDFALTVTAQIGRHDLILNAIQPEGGPDDLPARIESLPSALSQLMRLIPAVAANATILRTATVVELSQYHADARDAIRAISAESKAWFPEDGSDCVYQFNVRRFYPDSDTVMNRISTWSIGQIQQIPVMPFVGRVAFKSVWTANLKLDINCAPSRDSLSGRAAGMFQAQHDEALTIIDRGIEYLR